MLLADYIRDYSRTLLLPSAGLRPDDLSGPLAALESRARADFEAEGHQATELVLERSLDLRYRGQGYELGVPFGDEFEVAFHQAHERRYGYSDPTRPTEVVNIRVMHGANYFSGGAVPSRSRSPGTCFRNASERSLARIRSCSRSAPTPSGPSA